MKLSVVYATRNEEANIERSLQSIKDIADEIIIFDEHSTDKTTIIAKRFGAQVVETNHESNFHITKQKAISRAKGDWILQLDADEVVTKQLANEISEVISMDDNAIKTRTPHNLNDARLFQKHLSLLESTRGKIGNKDSEVVAFFVPRINMFVGYPLVHGGVYPDGVIRLIKNGKARLPAKSVHEQMQIDGSVAWLFSPLEHWDSPSVFRYISRLNRYTDLHAEELRSQKIDASLGALFQFTVVKPCYTFIDRFVLHRGYKDGLYGFVWAVFSAWHFPIAYFKYALTSLNESL